MFDALRTKTGVFLNLIMISFKGLTFFEVNTQEFFLILLIFKRYFPVLLGKQNTLFKYDIFIEE